MKKLAIFALVLAFCGTGRGDVCLRYSGESPQPDRQPFMFVVSTTYQGPGAIADVVPRQHAFTGRGRDLLDVNWWDPGLWSGWWAGDSGGGPVSGPPRVWNRPPDPPQVPDPPGNGSPPTTGKPPVDPGPGPQDPPGGGDPPGPGGGPSVVPEPTSALLWGAMGALLLAFTRRPKR
jgi:hypothetical protein